MKLDFFSASRGTLRASARSTLQRNRASAEGRLAEPFAKQTGVSALDEHCK
jgi:hypothetical protein